mmetsp:Transcript_5045/g.13473  ORF Transcript_5045/g.13473 Transcript_5045/m.13473 type:complete len:234 (+) Transcript_5045:2479-3180(+)
MVGFPTHPRLEYRPRVRDLPHHLLHVYVLVPELVDARQELHRSVPHVSRVVDELVRHLHLRVLEPQGLGPVVVVQRAFPHGPRAREVLLRFFPFGVLDPHGFVPVHASDQIFKFFTFLEAVLGEFLGVDDLLLWRAVGFLLAFLGLAHDLLGGDLRGCGRLVLDARGSRVGHFGGAAVQRGAQRALAHARHQCLSSVLGGPRLLVLCGGTGRDLAGRRRASASVSPAWTVRLR